MLGSLRFRLPALFLLGIVLAAIVATLIAVRFFQSNTRDACGLGAARGIGRDRAALRAEGRDRARPPRSLELELGGDKVFWVPAVPGALLLAGPLAALSSSACLPRHSTAAAQRAFDFDVRRYPLSRRRAAGHAGSGRRGALVVAERESALRARWLQLFWELALAFGIGIPVAGVLILYYSRRIARPLEELASAADEVAAGHYDVAVPERTWGSEIEQLAARFHEMTARLAESEQLSRNFLMSVSHELRTPLTAIRGHVAALREGVIDDEASQEPVARGGLGGGDAARATRR